MIPLSKSKIRKAGSAVRKFQRGELTAQDFEPHREIIFEYRQSFAVPLQKFRNDLVNLQDASSIVAETTSRLKRVPTIIEKLGERERGLDLSRMQDIAGCRVVVSDLESLYRLKKLVEENWDFREKNYIDNPRDSGYRSIHLVTEVDGFFIELQLRTEAMHKWAQTVETLSVLFGENLKQDGSGVIHEYMKMISDLMYDFEHNLSGAQKAHGRILKLGSEVKALILDQIQRGREEKL